MPINVEVTDLIDEASFVDSVDGASATRKFIISGLDASASAQERLYDACTFSGIPAKGDAHPALSSIYVLNKTAIPITNSNDKAFVTVEYGTPTSASESPDPPDTGYGQVSIGSSVQTVNTQKDKDGNQIQVSINIEKSTGQGGGTTTESHTQTGEVEINIPALVLRAVRLESLSPKSKALTYAGKVNSIGVWGFNSGTLLCTRIEGDSDDNGATYNVTYEFEHNPRGWKADVMYIDPETDQPHEQATISPVNGYTEVDVYQTIDFSGLGLNF